MTATTKPKNPILPSERQEMDDVIKFVEDRAAAVRMFVDMAEKADDFAVWSEHMSTAWRIARGRL